MDVHRSAVGLKPPTADCLSKVQLSDIHNDGLIVNKASEKVTE